MGWWNWVKGKENIFKLSKRDTPQLIESKLRLQRKIKEFKTKWKLKPHQNYLTDEQLGQINPQRLLEYNKDKKDLEYEEILFKYHKAESDIININLTLQREFNLLPGTYYNEVTIKKRHKSDQKLHHKLMPQLEQAKKEFAEAKQQLPEAEQKLDEAEQKYFSAQKQGPTPPTSQGTTLKKSQGTNSQGTNQTSQDPTNPNSQYLTKQNSQDPILLSNTQVTNSNMTQGGKRKKTRRHRSKRKHTTRRH